MRWVRMISAGVLMAGCSSPQVDLQRPVAPRQPVALSAEMERHLSFAQAMPTHRRDSLPGPVREFLSAGGPPIADPSERFNGGCFQDPDLPSFRLIEAGTSGPFVFVLYQHGGLGRGGVDLLVAHMEKERLVEAQCYSASGSPRGLAETRSALWFPEQGLPARMLIARPASLTPQGKR